eukprot:3543032-Rhodomonas_salina.3
MRMYAFDLGVVFAWLSGVFEVSSSQVPNGVMSDSWSPGSSIASRLVPDGTRSVPDGISDSWSAESSIATTKLVREQHSPSVSTGLRVSHGSLSTGQFLGNA